MSAGDTFASTCFGRIFVTATPVRKFGDGAISVISILSALALMPVISVAFLSLKSLAPTMFAKSIDSGFGLFGCAAYSRVNFTSSEANAWPSCHFTPGCRLNVWTLPSLDAVNVSARSGTTVMSGYLRRTRPFAMKLKMYAPTRARDVGPSVSGSPSVMIAWPPTLADGAFDPPLGAAEPVDGVEG